MSGGWSRELDFHEFRPDCVAASRLHVDNSGYDKVLDKFNRLQ
jgi:uncharacterized protein YdcH (DUF465 family)